MSCPMAPIGLLAGVVFSGFYILPLLSCWNYLVIIGLVLALWLTLFDADVTTYLTSLFCDIDESLVRGKVCWVIGASSGIGEALALQLSSKGAKVILSARREDELNRVAELCKKQPGVTETPIVLTLDVLNESDHQIAVSTILKKFNGQLDIVVLNVGRTQRALAEDTAVEVTRQMLALNTIALVGLAQACLPTFLKQKSGIFLVTSSVAGKMPAPASSSYCASKFALQGYFDALRLEVADRGIKICVACPGPVSTPIEFSAFTEEVGKVRGLTSENRAKKMKVERCAKLMMVAMTNGIDETWISHHPVLGFAYLAQYFPDVTRFIGKRWLGPMRTKAFKSGGDIYNFSEMAKQK